MNEIVAVFLFIGMIWLLFGKTMLSTSDTRTYPTR